MISRDVTFFESKFPYSNESKQEGVMQPENTIIREEENEEIEGTE